MKLKEGAIIDHAFGVAGLRGRVIDGEVRVAESDLTDFLGVTPDRMRTILETSRAEQGRRGPLVERPVQASDDKVSEERLRTFQSRVAAARRH